MRAELLKRFSTQEPEGSGQEMDGMIVGMLEPDYGFLTRAITLGGLDPRDETFEQKGSLVEQIEEVSVYLEDPTKKVRIGSC